MNNHDKNNHPDLPRDLAPDVSADAQWQDLQSQWQSYQPDIKKIHSKIQWVNWRMVALLTLDVIVVTGYFIFLYQHAQKPNTNWLVDLLLYAMAVFALYGLYFDFKIRMPIFRLNSESTKDILGLYLKRCQVGITMGRVSKQCFYMMLIVFWFWIAAMWLLFPGETKFTSLKTIAWGTCWIGAFIGGAHWYQQKKQKEFNKLKSLWQDYLD